MSTSPAYNHPGVNERIWVAHWELPDPERLRELMRTMETPVNRVAPAQAPKKRIRKPVDEPTVDVTVRLVLQAEKPVSEIMRLPAQLARRGYAVVGFQFSGDGEQAV